MGLLSCEGLVKTFDGICALNNVTLQFSYPGLVAIIGPNGAGKTTLLNVLTGFSPTDAGKCFVDKVETTHLTPYRIARLGIARTFQDLRLVLFVSVLDNVMLARPNQFGETLLGALFRFGVSREEEHNRQACMELLRVVGLEDKANHLAGDLSYGEQKLLTVASCLATQARILLLDEPVAGVYPGMAIHILDLLRKVKNEGRLVVFVEHDLAAVRQIAERVIVMDEGGIIADGPPSEVLDRPEILEAYVA